ncbi:DUF4347 domain-containing protein, partial [Nostoc sp.]|uniref:DUF4347 domain-containing protein n=1 Tax=Nostoc sp. TaxID=1180 RepID=UPI002FFCB88B
MSFELPQLGTSSTDLLSKNSLAPVLDEGSLTTSLTGLGRSSQSLLFVDKSVTDYQQLLAGVTPGTEIHILDPGQDSVTQITNTLLGRQNIASLHIVSHGEAGGVDFGSSALNSIDLPEYAAQLKTWSKALTNDADILFYGCNVAQGQLGQAFVQNISQVTGADVAASNNLTGKDGDWILEFNTGQIESGLAFQASTLANYQASLISVTSTGNAATLLSAIAGDTTGLSNITATVTGNPQAFGTFTSDPFGFGSGVVISTGAVTNVVGPNNNTGAGTNFGTAGDVAGSFDLAKLDISFNADNVDRSLFFRFVFGSEEFPEYAGSNFNDSFELLLNGVNLARLSNGSTVTINNLATSPTGPFDPDYIANPTNNPDTQLDGYTRALTFEGAVIKNSLNTVSIRIRDTGDGGLDSAAFLKVNSFGTAPPSSKPVLTLSGNSASYSVGSAPILLDTNGTITDSDSPNFDTGILAVEISNNATATDQLAIKNQGTGVGQIGVSGSNVTYNFGSGAVNIGTFKGGTNGTTPLVITFNNNSTPIAAQALLGNITFFNSSATPSTSSRTISFNITDGDGGNSTVSTETVNIVQNAAPTISTNSLNISEGGSVVLSSSNINATDDNTPDQLTYTATGISSGQFELVANAGVAITSFTQAQINSGAVSFVQNGGETAPSYSLSVSDGSLSSASSTGVIGFTNVNDAPTISTNSLNISEGGSVVLSSSNLNATDPDNTPVQLTYTATGISGGQFELVANAGVAITSFTQAQINSGAVSFVQNGSETAPSYTLSVSDGSLSSPSSTVAIGTFTKVNDAPTISTNSLNISEGGSVVLSSSNLNATDPDNTPVQLTYTATGISGGQFELVANAG